MSVAGPDRHPASLAPDELLAGCDERARRGTGPGGQHKNKVETGVVLVHRDSGLSGAADERRSRVENRKVALFRLRLRLALERRWPLPPGSPSALWRSRLHGGRISVNPGHADFPALLAEALDTLAAGGWDPAAAGQALGTSATQVVRLLASEPRALALLNAERGVRGLPPRRA